MQSLLTDPRISDEDYSFFDDNPFQPPPTGLNHVQDLNTGLAYTETYKKLIKNPEKQILLPVIFHIDGANTGQFVDLPLTAVKMSLGIFTCKARDKAHLWGTLGCIPAYSHHISKGNRLFMESGHMDSVIAFPTAGCKEGQNINTEMPKAQDLHTILDKILYSHIKLQETGFKWDLQYRGKVYQDVEFVLFTPFMKLDSDEAEKLCGKFTSRTGNVKHICRYCECPTNQSNDPFANYPMKTKLKIKPYVTTMRWNYCVKYLNTVSKMLCIESDLESHNSQGIHGTCPMDMLHASLLGIFRHTQDCIFEQIGPDSKLADDINAYARQYGDILSRQSDRDFPCARFNNGIRRGKLNAKDFPRILLCLAITLRSFGVRTRLPRKKGICAWKGRLRTGRCF